MWINKNEDLFTGLCVGDSVYGTVIGGYNGQVLIKLESGQQAAASFGGLRPGMEVLCSVTGTAGRNRNVPVIIDSVLEEEMAAA